MFGLIIGVIIAVAALVTIDPSILGVTSQLALRFPFAQAISFRVALAVGFLLLGVTILAVAGARRRGAVSVALGVIFLVVAAGHGLTVMDRGVHSADLSSDPGVTAAGRGNGSITVLEMNTLGGEASVTEIADLVAANGVDAVSLPETRPTKGAEIVAQLEARGLHFQQFDRGVSKWDPSYTSTVLLVSTDLGRYRRIDIPSDGTIAGGRMVAAVPVAGTGPEFIAVHPVAPVHSLMATWRADIRAAYGLCGSHKNAVLLGDFNSTTDHEAALGADSCRDAGREAGVAGLGTWPSSAPSILAAPIDRVFAPAGYEGTAGRVVHVTGSDHRALVVRLTPTK